MINKKARKSICAFSLLFMLALAVVPIASAEVPVPTGTPAPASTPTAAPSGSVPTSGILKGVKCAGGGTVTAVPGQTGSSFRVSDPCGLCDFMQVFVNGSNMIVAFSGAVAILIFIYAGIMYLTASFNQGNLEKAKSSIKAALIGLAFIFGAYTIVNFLILTLVGGKISNLSSVTGISEGWGVCSGYNAGT